MKTLRPTWCLLALGFLAFSNLGAAAPEKFQFDGETFRKAFSDKSSEGPFSEYLPKGQSLESWTKLMGYYEYPKLSDAKQAVVQFAAVLKDMNPDAKSEVVYNETTGEAVIDFVTWPKDGAYVEFNVWKYRKSPDGGLQALQFAERAYGKNTDAFFKKLGKRRIALRDALIALPW